MGFGLLFFGYFLTFAFTASKVYFFADIIGCVIMLAAFAKLAQYNRYYTSAVVSTVVFTLFAFSSAMLLLFRVSAGEGVETALDVTKALSSCALHVFMFLGIRGISKGAECEKLVRKAEWSLCMTSVYFAVLLLVGGINENDVKITHVIREGSPAKVIRQVSEEEIQASIDNAKLYIEERLIYAENEKSVEL